MEYSGRLLPDSLEPAGYSDKSGDLNRASSAGSTTSSSFHDSALASVRHPALLRHASPPKEAESERSAPVAKGCFLLAERKRGRVTGMTRDGADTGEYLKLDRGFESGSLHRRVGCEPDFLDHVGADARSRPLPLRRMLRSPTTAWKVGELLGWVISRRAPDDVNQANSGTPPF